MATEYDYSTSVNEDEVSPGTTLQKERHGFKDSSNNAIANDANEKDMFTSQISNASSTATSTTTANSHNDTMVCVGVSNKQTPITSPDPTAYVTKARVTRPTPPPPSYNPMQFVQIKPCNLYQTAQEQLKKAEEVKKIKEIKKEEPEDWQNNLDNWKSSRRKRVEHIIDRVSEVKKLELEEHDRNRRKSKTFSEMIEERDERGGPKRRVKLASLAVYNEEEGNDFSDLGIGHSSASGKSSLSDDYDNNSVLSDNIEMEKAIYENNDKQNGLIREYISSPGYDTSSSTAPASSPDFCEYTYEGAIQDYKQRVSRATASTSSAGASATNTNNYKPLDINANAKTSNVREPIEGGRPGSYNPIRNLNTSTPTESSAYPVRRGSKIEDRLISFEVTSPSDSQEGAEKQKPMDVPKIDISKRKEMFESHGETAGNVHMSELKSASINILGVAPRVTLRDRFNLNTNSTSTMNNTDAPKLNKVEMKGVSEEITIIRDRLEKQDQSTTSQVNGTKLVDIPVLPLKDRLYSLQNAVTKDEVKKPPIALIDARQLEIMRNEEQKHKKQLEMAAPKQQSTVAEDGKENYMQAVGDVENEQRRNAERLLLQKEQEQQLNEAIAALAVEERQLEDAANAVNQIEAEFAELSSATSEALPVLISANSSNNSAAMGEQPLNEMEFSVSCINNSLLPINANPNSSTRGYLSNSNSCTLQNFNKSTDRDISLAMGCTTSQQISDPTATNLRRKPSNEMVHGHNLLKMFKDTFKNDIELDEADESSHVSSNAKSSFSPKILKCSKCTCVSVSECGCSPTSPNSSTNIIAASISSIGSATLTDPLCLSSMPQRPINPLGKPPMSPKATVRSSTRPLLQRPNASPTSCHKNDNHFSINGRVEIFNSKDLSHTSLTIPTILSKKEHSPHSPMPIVIASKVIVDSQQPEQQNDSPASHLVTEALPTLSTIRTVSPTVESVSTKPVNEPQVILSPQPQHTEVVMCAPPVPLLNPSELPKPNTVKALSSCFSHMDAGNTTPSSPKPMLRTRIPQASALQMPIPAKRNLSSELLKPIAADREGVAASPADVPHLRSTAVKDEEYKKLSVSSNAPTTSTESQGPSVLVKTAAVVHSPPTIFMEPIKSVHKPLSQLNIGQPAVTAQCCTSQLYPSSQITAKDPLTPNASLEPVITTPAQMPPLVVCSPNDSALFKLALSAPSSPVSPTCSVGNLDETDIAFCTLYLDSALHKPPQIPKLLASERQQTVDEVPCDKVDIHQLPVRRCDNFVKQMQAKAPESSYLSSKPNSPIVEARAAHSKALIETCEKIIAEERMASNRLKSSLPQTPKATPLLQRKSKIPKPIQCCIGGNESMSRGDFESIEERPLNAATLPLSKSSDDVVIARAHVVETQIKVTTSAPQQTSSQINSMPHVISPGNKKNRNIFDFLKKNFGHHDSNDAPTVPTESPSTNSNNINTVKVDEIFTIDNSKFYVPSEEASPPPLPLTPAPVNIEIMRKITTDEILDESKADNIFSQEINDLLDEEMNKLS